jgi:hypothetical protein
MKYLIMKARKNDLKKNVPSYLLIMKVYVVLHSFLWDNPTNVVGVFTSKDKAIEALIEDVHTFERQDTTEVVVTDREIILHDLQRQYKEYFCKYESVWNIRETKFHEPSN